MVVAERMGRPLLGMARDVRLKSQGESFGHQSCLGSVGLKIVFLEKACLRQSPHVMVMEKGYRHVGVIGRGCHKYFLLEAVAVCLPLQDVVPCKSVT